MPLFGNQGFTIKLFSLFLYFFFLIKTIYVTIVSILSRSSYWIFIHLCTYYYQPTNQTKPLFLQKAMLCLWHNLRWWLHLWLCQRQSIAFRKSDAFTFGDGNAKQKTTFCTTINMLSKTIDFAFIINKKIY